jgi:hypothetical protein
MARLQNKDGCVLDRRGLDRAARMPVEVMTPYRHDHQSGPPLRPGSLFAASARHAGTVLHRLPTAIEVPAEVVETAVKATASLLAEMKWQEDEKLRIARENEDAEWRATFIPHAIILGERKIPTSITMYAISGGSDRNLTIELDISKSSNTFVEQALAALPSKLHLGKDGRLTVPFFGYALGFIVNYSPDQAVRYDLKGNAVENLSKAFRLGRASFSLKGGTQIADIGGRLEVVEISTT